MSLSWIWQVAKTDLKSNNLLFQLPSEANIQTERIKTVMSAVGTKGWWIQNICIQGSPRQPNMFCQKLKKLQFTSIFNNLLPKGHQNYSCVKLSVPIIEKNLGWNISLLIRCYINGWTQIQTQGLGLPPFACGRRKKFWCGLLVTPGRGLRLIPGRCRMVVRMEERTRMTFLHPRILVRE